MKRFYLLMLLALGISGMQAQKIDQRLTRLAKQTNLHRVQGKQTLTVRWSTTSWASASTRTPAASSSATERNTLINK